MRGLVSGAALFAMATASVVACTFIVDGQTKDLSGTCQIQGIADNVCGRCVTKNCQTKIDGLCASSQTTSDVTACVQRPSPGRNWNCANLISAATLDASISAAQNDLNHCIAGCTNECSTCTTIDAGTGRCGTCIMTSCGDLLNGNDGCCDDTTVNDGIAKCVADVNPSCSQFRMIVADILANAPEAGSDAAPPRFQSCKDDSPQQFAKCVVDNCVDKCPQ